MPRHKLIRLLTLSVLAEELDQPIHRIRYLLASRRHILAVATAGNTRLYPSVVLRQLRAEIVAIDSRKNRSQK